MSLSFPAFSGANARTNKGRMRYRDPDSRRFSREKGNESCFTYGSHDTVSSLSTVSKHEIRQDFGEGMASRDQTGHGRPPAVADEQ